MNTPRTPRPLLNRRVVHVTAAILITLAFATATPAAASAAPTFAASAPSAVSARQDQWHLRYLHITEAHQQSQGEGVIVGVIDTGVDTRHPDLAGTVTAGIDYTTYPSTDTQTDTDGHGTAMAGLIAAHGDATGIAPKATIVAGRDALNTLGYGSGTVRAIDWAVDHGATVLCLAFGGADDTQLHRAIDRAIAHDVVIVAGVGNNPAIPGYIYPAAYPGVVGAAGIDKNGDHAAVSVIGPQALLAAPAVDITSTRLNGGYGKGTGTSDATAIIAGAAALIRSRYPHLTAPQVINHLTTTADDKGPPGRDNQYGHGVINIVRALTTTPPTPQPTDNQTDNANDIDTTQPGKPNLWLIAGAVALTIIIVPTLMTIATRRRHHADATKD